MENDKEFGSFWKLIFSEYKLTKTLLKIVTFNLLWKMNLLERHQLMQGRNCTAIIDYSTICFNAIAKKKEMTKTMLKNRNIRSYCNAIFFWKYKCKQELCLSG